MADYRKPSAVKLPGFAFRPGPVFSNTLETSYRIYAALLGEDHSNLTLDDARDRACHSLVALFETALQYEGLYRALRGGHDFWQVLTSNVALNYDVTPDEIKLMLVTMTKARTEYSGHAAPSYINDLVDKFITLEKETNLLGPPHTFTVTASPAAVAAHESRQMISGLASDLRNLNIVASWPLSYFSTKDLIFLADKNVAAILGGVDSENNSTRQPVPAVNSMSLPITLRVNLFYLALMFSQDKDWALFLTPVGFLDYNLRREWYMLAGRQISVFATALQFLEYAGDAITRRNKTFAVGMHSHWLLQSHNLPRTANFVDNDPARLWTGHEMMRRYTTLLILQKIVTPFGLRVYLIWYDPWFHDPSIKRQFAHSQYSITDGRRQGVGQ